MSASNETDEYISFFDKYESNVRSYCRDYPTVFGHASGPFITNIQGLRFIDFLCGAGALNYGHNDKYLKERLLSYIASDSICHSLDLHSAAKKRFIETFNEVILVPRGLRYKIQFTGPTGTNAVEAALKLARKVTGRTNVIAFTNAYHGMSLGSLAATTNPSKRAGSGLPLSGVTFMPYEGYLGEDVDAFAAMEAMLSPGSGVDKPAAFIVETIQGEGGLRFVSAEWMQRLRMLAVSLDALLIVDDIQSGCGRSGDFFSFDPLGVTPDIVCLSKSLSGYGLPMSVTLIRPELDVWQPGEHNGTFRGNNHPFVTASAALEQYWASTNFRSDLNNKIRILDDRLQGIGVKVSKAFAQAGDLRGRGFMRGVDLGDDELARQISQKAFQSGLIVETCGVFGQVLKIFPPLTIDTHTLSDGLDILETSVEAVIWDKGEKAA